MNENRAVGWTLLVVGLLLTLPKSANDLAAWTLGSVALVGAGRRLFALAASTEKNDG